MKSQVRESDKMADDHPCCKALEEIEERVLDSITLIENLPGTQQQELHRLRARLHEIRELCDATRGAGMR
jgi:hypothetical protein